MDDMQSPHGNLFAAPKVRSRTASDGTIYLTSGYSMPQTKDRVTIGS